MNVSDLCATVESLDGVTSVDSYTADHNQSQPVVIEVIGGDDEKVMGAIEESLADDEAALRMANGSYMVYRPLGAIDEHDGSKFDILEYNDASFEAVLVEESPIDIEVGRGTVLTFDRYDTHYEVTLYDE